MQILPSDMERYKAIIAPLGMSEREAFDKITLICQLAKSLFDLADQEDTASHALRAKAKDSFRFASDHATASATRTMKLDDLGNEGATNAENLNEVRDDTRHSQGANLLPR